MKARWWWFGYALAAAVVVTAMSWFTYTVRTSQETERQTARAAFADETSRLALWRMDSWLATLIAREAGRPYIDYNAFYPAQGALDNRVSAKKGYGNFKEGEVVVPSPLLNSSLDEVLLHVQMNVNGKATSPQVPVGELRKAAVPLYCAPAQVANASKRLASFTAFVDSSQLDAALRAAPPAQTEQIIVQRPFIPDQQIAMNLQQQTGDFTQERAQSSTYASRSGKEWAARNTNVQVLANKSQQEANPSSSDEQVKQGSYVQDFYQAAQINDAWGEETNVPSILKAEVMRPLWVGETNDTNKRLLVLARRVHIGSDDWLQACWLNWDYIRTHLLGTIHDLLPEATLMPLFEDETSSPHRLATLPVKLVPGGSMPDWEEPPPPSQLPLYASWAGVIMALIAGGALLGGALTLSERRGAFVSAVTHELRTPLTTFRLYTDLLAENRVVDEEQRARALETLRTEAERLGHLVENVLGYAKLERVTLPIASLGLASLIGSLVNRLRERTNRAEMELAVELPAHLEPLAVRGEAQAIERILINLVDNACKYASAAKDKRLHLIVGRNGQQVMITIRDHGVGIGDDLAWRLFTPFAKSAKDAAVTAPGIGLGLALSRRLARQLGGDLRYTTPADGGAAFTLVLPLA